VALSHITIKDPIWRKLESELPHLPNGIQVDTVTLRVLASQRDRPFRSLYWWNTPASVAVEIFVAFFHWTNFFDGIHCWNCFNQLDDFGIIMPNPNKMIDMSQNDSNDDEDVTFLKTHKKKRRRAIVDDEEEDSDNIPTTASPPNKNNIDRFVVVTNREIVFFCSSSTHSCISNRVPSPLSHICILLLSIAAQLFRRSARSPSRPTTQSYATDLPSAQDPSIRPTTQKPATSEASKEEKLQKFLATQKQQWITPKPTTETLFTRPKAEALVMQDLRDICHQFRLPADNAPPLLQIPTKKRVDLFGTFLYDEDPNQRQQEFDFFDTNDRGEIVLSTPPRIFPEEFVETSDHPRSNTAPEYGPTWWGIIEPKLGVGKYIAPPPDPSTTRTDASITAKESTAAPLSNGNQASVGAPTVYASHRGTAERVDRQHGRPAESRQRPSNVPAAVDRHGGRESQPQQYRTGRPDESSRHPGRW
jgi:hypothetical protein